MSLCDLLYNNMPILYHVPTLMGTAQRTKKDEARGARRMRGTYSLVQFRDPHVLVGFGHETRCTQ